MVETVTATALFKKCSNRALSARQQPKSSLLRQQMVVSPLCPVSRRLILHDTGDLMFVVSSHSSSKTYLLVMTYRWRKILKGIVSRYPWPHSLSLKMSHPSPLWPRRLQLWTVLVHHHRPSCPRPSLQRVVHPSHPFINWWLHFPLHFLESQDLPERVLHHLARPLRHCTN